MPGVWEYATAADIGKAAKDWPQMNFVMYHSCLRPAFELPDQAWTEFEQTGRIRWVSDLADIPQKFGVTNVYAELGTSFANSAVAHPKFCAALRRHADQGHGRRPRPVGHRFGLVRLAAVADRGDAPARNPRGHAEEVRVRRARRRQQRHQAADLLRQRGPDVQHPAEEGRATPGCRPFPRTASRRSRKSYALAAAERSNLRYGYVRSD